MTGCCCVLNYCRKVSPLEGSKNRDTLLKKLVGVCRDGTRCGWMCIHVFVCRWVGMYSLLKKLVCVCGWGYAFGHVKVGECVCVCMMGKCVWWGRCVCA